MDYSPWFNFWESKKSCEKRIPSERASQEEQTGANFTKITSYVHVLPSMFKCMHDDLYHRFIIL